MNKGLSRAEAKGDPLCQSVSAARGGFTLIELSIVLIIISLIVAGVTGGKALVKQAELQSVASEYGKLQTAVNTFILQYDFLPGDFPDASQYWNIAACPSGPCDGDGDDTLDGETLRATQHLALAELIPGEYTGDLIAGDVLIGQNVSPSKIDGVGFWLVHQPASNLIYGRFGNNIKLGSTLGTAGALNGSALTTLDAIAVDRKIDDGIADSGILYGIHGRDSTGAFYTSCLTNPETAASSSYVESNELVTCRLLLWLDE